MLNIILTTNLLLAQEIKEWELIKNNDDIQVYVQKVSNSQLRKIKIETVVEASLSELIALFKDAENHKNWVFLSKSAKIVQSIDEYTWIYYSHSDAPWPVSDRDYYTKVQMAQNKTDYSVKLLSVSIPNYKPEIKGCVRIQSIHSVWLLTPTGNGIVHLSFKLEVDPGGSIPYWIVNLVSTKGPYITMIGLIDELKTKRYQNTNFDYIKEL